MSDNAKKPLTVKVRIAVAVDPSGDWSAAGHRDATWKDVDYILDGVGNGEARYWVEAELPIPETRTVESSGVLKMEEPDA